MKVQPDFSEAIGPIKAGSYICRILEATMKVGKDSGNPYILWKLETVPDRQWVFHNTPIQGRGAGILKHFVHCAGNEFYEGGEFDTDTLINHEVLMTLAVEKTFNQKGQEVQVFKVKMVNKPNGSVTPQPSPAPNDDIPF